MYRYEYCTAGTTAERVPYRSSSRDTTRNPENSNHDDSIPVGPYILYQDDISRYVRRIVPVCRYTYAYAIIN